MARDPATREQIDALLEAAKAAHRDLVRAYRPYHHLASVERLRAAIIAIRTSRGAASEWAALHAAGKTYGSERRREDCIAWIGDAQRQNVVTGYGPTEEAARADALRQWRALEREDGR